MLQVLGVVHTKESILGAFQFLCMGEEHISSTDLAKLFTADETAFIAKTAPPTADGYQFQPWIDEIFLR